MASRFYERLLSLWRGTCAGRLSGRDSIPWYYDLLEADPCVELVLDAQRYLNRADALCCRTTTPRAKAPGVASCSDR
jgi:hypothetical protein